MFPRWPQRRISWTRSTRWSRATPSSLPLPSTWPTTRLPPLPSPSMFARSRQTGDVFKCLNLELKTLQWTLWYIKCCRTIKCWRVRAVSWPCCRTVLMSGTAPLPMTRSGSRWELYVLNLIARQFGGQRSLDPLEKPLEIAEYVFPALKKNLPHV